MQRDRLTLGLECQLQTPGVTLDILHGTEQETMRPLWRLFLRRLRVGLGRLVRLRVGLYFLRKAAILFGLLFLCPSVLLGAVERRLDRRRFPRSRDQS